MSRMTDSDETALDALIAVACFVVATVAIIGMMGML